tara:strand:+ start:5658 stop:5837 length:180 start_codon:yes stop_codon:yes gene_type:complete
MNEQLISFCCPNCGGNMEGDGYTRVLHCEFVDDTLDIEPDANPIFCKENANCPVIGEAD